MKINEKHKDIVEERGYIYKFTYERNDVTIDKNIVLNFSTLIRIQCPYCKREYDIRLEHFKRGDDCVKCCNKYENSFAYYIIEELRLNIEDVWDFKSNNINPYHIAKFKNEKIWVFCLGCGKLYQSNCCNYSRGCKCKDCGLKERVKNRLITEEKLHIEKETIIKEIVEEEGYKYFEYKMERNKHGKNEKFIKIQCENHHKPYWVRLYDFKRGNRCKNCNVSKGERVVMDWLIRNNFCFIYDQSYFEDLIGVGGGILRPDFILPNEKIWIEFDGEQHYRLISEYFDFYTIKSNDEIKNKYAKENNYKLIRIRYDDFDKIEEILNKEIRGWF